MYAGSVIEYAETRSLFQRPYHPYTWALLQSIPRLDETRRALQTIRGSSPNPIDLPYQCPYMPRCPKASSTCDDPDLLVTDRLPCLAPATWWARPAPAAKHPREQAKRLFPSRDFH